MTVRREPFRHFEGLALSRVMSNSIVPGETEKQASLLKLGLITSVHRENLMEQGKRYQEYKSQTCGMLKCMYPPESEM